MRGLKGIKEYERRIHGVDDKGLGVHGTQEPA